MRQASREEGLCLSKSATTTLKVAGSSGLRFSLTVKQEPVPEVHSWTSAEKVDDSGAY